MSFAAPCGRAGLQAAPGAPRLRGIVGLSPAPRRWALARAQPEPKDAAGSDKNEGPRSFQHPEFDGSDIASTSSTVPDSLPAALGTEEDWRAFRARLVASSKGTQATPGTWAHAIPKPERGAVLLAHPLMFVTGSQPYFFRAVILLLEHTAEGSYGVILNKPSTLTMGELPVKAQNLEQFQSCRLYCGGDVGHGEVIMVHAVPGLEGAVEVVKGVHIGGIASASKAIEAGTAKPSDFKWFTNYAGWGPGQLESECKRGVWFTAAASPQLLLGAPEVNIELWNTLLEHMGGDYAALAKAVKEREDLKGGMAAEQPNEDE